MTNIQTNLQLIEEKISKAAALCDRDPKTIILLAVSKTKPSTQIEQAILAGQLNFGENYVQEGIDKIIYFRKTQPKTPIMWHFIGPLQSNKTKIVAEHFDWVQTIDRLKIATRLSEQRPAHLPALNVLIQVNISQEESKSGIHPDELWVLADQINQLPHLKLRGLMAIPKPESDPNKQFETCKAMHDLYQKLQNQYPSIDTLSMGMSDDMQSAIMAGSTMVRIGTAIFGAR